MKFYIGSVGKPGEKYVEENHKRIVDNKAFVMIDETGQRSIYNEMNIGDIIFLRQDGMLTAYGEIRKLKIKNDEEWTHWAYVHEWYFYDEKNKTIGVPRNGVSENTLAGGHYDTLKEITTAFAFQKMKEINYHSPLLGRMKKKVKMQHKTEITNLIKYKKQIILQGPPGTGKTRLANHIAETLVLKNEINVNYLKSLIKVGYEFWLRSNMKLSTVEEVFDDRIVLDTKESLKAVSLMFSDIVESINNRDYKNTDYVEYKQYIIRSIAQDVVERVKHAIKEQTKLIQFHPSYTYEDFVRGIIADSNGNTIAYKNVNKTLGLFAETALKNFLDSQKAPELVSKESWVSEQYQNFKDYLAGQLEQKKELVIKEGTVPQIIAIEESALRVIRYSNKDNSVLLKDTDIIDGYIGVCLSIPSVNVRYNHKLSRSAQGYMYYLYQNVVDKFKEYLLINGLSFDQQADGQKQELKNYVLIIDEVNRANLSSVLGELIYALEYRGEAVDSMYEVDGSAKLTLPPNLYIIGTMNTADRSVGHIDYAIRRRFSFVDVLPQLLSSDHEIVFHDDLFRRVSELFIANFDEYVESERAILKPAKTLSPEFKPEDVWLGHSYFIQNKEKDENGNEILIPEDFSIRLKYEIKPILMEYEKDGILIGEVYGMKIADYIKSL